MKRRVLLAGLGTASIGVGAAFGSGAFTSIEADRDVELNVSDDSDTQISFEPGSGTGSGRIIELQEINGTEIISFDQDDLNEQATTTIEDALKIGNNVSDDRDGSIDVEIYVQEDGDVAEDGILDFKQDGDSIVGTESNDGFRLDDTEEEEIDIIVDLRDENNDGEDLGDIDQVTFVVEAVDE